MKDMIETYRGAVYPWHCDQMGHMNVMWYVGKFDEATWNLFATIGVTFAYLRENKRGMAAVQQDITYKRELLAGDTVTVHSTLLEVRDKSAKFVHEMRHGVTGEVAAVCVLTGVSIDTQTRKSCPFAVEIVERARSLVGTYDLGRR
jgi:acyl-CoA thioester hydrolase